jgi:hypothetical protein
MAYIMENSRDILNELIHEGIYRDDGITVLKGSVTTGEVAKWLGIFQARVNHLVDSKFLEFTTEIWGNDKDDRKKYKAVGTTNKNYFPFLDMEMYWSPIYSLFGDGEGRGYTVCTSVDICQSNQ